MINLTFLSVKWGGRVQMFVHVLGNGMARKKQIVTNPLSWPTSTQDYLTDYVHLI